MGGVWLSEGVGERGVWDSQCVNSRFTACIHLNLNLHSEQQKDKDFCVKIPLARSLPAEGPSPSKQGLCHEHYIVSSSSEWHKGNWKICLSGLHACTIHYTQRGCSHTEHPLTKSSSTCFVFKWQVDDTFGRNEYSAMHACWNAILHSLESIQQVHWTRTGYHCRYTDLRSHWAFCCRTFRMIIIRCWND